MSFDPNSITKPTLVVANGIAYLGIVDTNNDSVSIKHAMGLGPITEITASNLNDYMATAFEDKLTVVKMSAAADWTSTDLDSDLDVSWEIAKLQMKQAIKRAPVDTVLASFKKG